MVKAEIEADEVIIIMKHQGPEIHLGEQAKDGELGLMKDDDQERTGGGRSWFGFGFNKWRLPSSIIRVDSHCLKQGENLRVQGTVFSELPELTVFSSPSIIAPFDDALVVLAYVPGEDGEKDFSSTAPSRQGNAQRPEVRIVTWNNDELSTDALPVHGFEHYKPKDYSLAHAPFSGSSNAGGQWAAGDEPLYYIVSPKDVVIAKPRDTEDHITWLLQHGWHEKALAVVESSHGRSELLDEVGSRYLDHLIVERKYSEAASLCPKLLRGSASAWERWVFHFAHLRQLPVLVPYMPTENPRLRDSAYEVALNALATNPSFHKDLLSTIKSWPPVIYSALSVISAIEPQLKTSSMTEPLKEALAELYVINGQHEKAVALYADLMKPEVFDFIDKHKLHGAIREKVFQLMMIDCKRAVPLLIQAKNLISSPEVVKQLQNADNESDSRYFLHLYLHSLFEVNPHAGRDFHDMQDSLTALKEKLQRTVYRLTLVKGWNTEDIDAYYELISIGEPDFVEIKGVTYCGSSATSKLTMENVPWHAYVKAFSEALALKSQGEYEVACEHAHSCCVLLAKIKKFKIDGKWYTWIDYDKFHDLVASGRTFDSTDYMTATPSWAVYGAEEGGFDPEQSRYRKERRHHKSSRNQSG
ncbi:uncharacterized protein DS421_13g445810 [Arachis hypogaea]|nr:uncharacterized protein DS421_13g445810 [Arachis hypogaea]